VPELTGRSTALQYAAVIGVAFGLTFIAELPDKSMFASLVLGTRYRASWVWAGSAAALAVHMAIAVTAGQLIALLPRHVVDGVVAGLFLAGSAYMWWTSFRGDDGEETVAASVASPRGSFLTVAGTSFAVVFLAEWGDVTQLTAANLAARYNPVLVFVGSTLGLWLVAGFVASPGSSCWVSASTPPYWPPLGKPIRRWPEPRVGAWMTVLFVGKIRIRPVTCNDSVIQLMLCRA
jgi:Ca2+/H+ antiporter, TMEM165/GDT1 family